MHKVTDTIKREIQSFVGTKLPDHDIYVCGVGAYEDFDGDELINVELCYRAPNVPLGARATANLLIELRSHLLAMGEDRFPFLRHNLQPGQRLESTSNGE
jgi:hypothetical protein